MQANKKLKRLFKRLDSLASIAYINGPINKNATVDNTRMLPIRIALHLLRPLKMVRPMQTAVERALAMKA